MSTTLTRSLLGRVLVPRTTVRWRLTLLYGGMFLACGAALLAITYALVAHAPIGSTIPQHRRPLPAALRRLMHHRPVPAAGSRPLHSAPFLPQSSRALARYVTHQQRIEDLHQLMIWSAIALAVMAGASMLLGWIVAGRVLAPLRKITATAQQISDANLHQRLSIEGPHDELRELADTIDGLLGRLEVAFEAQRRFVANASHELRSPLTTMRATLDVAIAKPRGASAELRALDTSLREDLDQAGRLVESFLVLAGAQSGEIGKPTTVSLDHAITDSMERQASAIAEKRLEVRTNLTPVSVPGSDTLIKRMITNVIGNAILHTPAGGAIHVQCAPEARRAQLIVENSGPALDPLAVVELAQPFRRLGAERTDSRNGFGLGLSIISAIAAAHDGTLTLSARPTGGLRVEIALPNTAVTDEIGARS